MFIAGHVFEQTTGGRRCTTVCPGTDVPCAMPWLHTRSATAKDIGTEGFAHLGKMDQFEYGQIERERIREEKELWAGIVGASVV